MSKEYRKGAIGAILDVYEQQIQEMKTFIHAIPANWLEKDIDTATTDENCKSVQAILTHVVYAGYGYATSIANNTGRSLERPAKAFYTDLQSYADALDKMFVYTADVFASLNDTMMEEYEEALKIKTNWGQRYDIEQLMEHAIVHVMRHKRQMDSLLQSHGVL